MGTVRYMIRTRDWPGLAILILGGAAYCALVMCAVIAIVHGVRP